MRYEGAGFRSLFAFVTSLFLDLDKLHWQAVTEIKITYFRVISGAKIYLHRQELRQGYTLTQGDIYVSLSFFRKSRVQWDHES